MFLPRQSQTRSLQLRSDKRAIFCPLAATANANHDGRDKNLETNKIPNILLVPTTRRWIWCVSRENTLGPQTHVKEHQKHKQRRGWRFYKCFYFMIHSYDKT